MMPLLCREMKAHTNTTIVAIFSPMFEDIFKVQVGALTNNDQLITKLWSEIKTSYSRPGRHYHNLSHLDNLLSELTPLKNKTEDWQTIIFSIAYHDIVYNTLKSDNEEKSAQLAFKRLSALSITIDQRDKCCTQILATKGHNITNDNDTNLFTDADLSILGSESNKYKQYATMIRKEYKLYPDLIYKPGRRKVLEYFLNMPQIYKTHFFRTKYEVQARINLTEELKKLSS
jgi:predicted metal-dependent HD superfamily phosphohydrolase